MATQYQIAGELKNATDEPIVGATITVTPVPPFTLHDGTNISQPSTTTTASNGAWSFMLYPSPVDRPAAYYKFEVTVPGETRTLLKRFRMPDANATLYTQTPDTDFALVVVPTGSGVALPGPRGHTGPKGDKGDDGATGPQGPKGDAGTNGRDGTDGAQGHKGDPGAKGDTGARGLQGPAGPAGADGTDGTDGVDGAPGPAGPAGADGTDGTDGVGVPAGGATGQHLAKRNADDYQTRWVDPPTTFSGDYNDLTSKPTIPAQSKFATGVQLPPDPDGVVADVFLVSQGINRGLYEKVPNTDRTPRNQFLIIAGSDSTRRGYLRGAGGFGEARFTTKIARLDWDRRNPREMRLVVENAPNTVSTMYVKMWTTAGSQLFSATFSKVASLSTSSLAYFRWRSLFGSSITNLANGDILTIELHTDPQNRVGYAVKPNNEWVYLDDEEIIVAKVNASQGAIDASHIVGHVPFLAFPDVSTLHSGVIDTFQPNSLIIDEGTTTDALYRVKPSAATAFQHRNRISIVATAGGQFDAYTTPITGGIIDNYLNVCGRMVWDKIYNQGSSEIITLWLDMSVLDVSSNGSPPNQLFVSGIPSQATATATALPRPVRYYAGHRFKLYEIAVAGQAANQFSTTTLTFFVDQAKTNAFNFKPASGSPGNTLQRIG